MNKKHIDELNIAEENKIVRDNINNLNDEYNVYITIFDDDFNKEKIPYALKDNISLKGKRMTAGSKYLKSYISPYNATVVDRLNDKYNVVGKTNLDSFAFGSSTENSGYFITKNPYDKSRVAGGSSGGSAAAVGLNMATFALGTDTGGSVRLPASFCGVVGYKPTYGLLSRYGLAAMGSSLDVPGIISRSVYDCSYVLNSLISKDPKDVQTYESEVNDFTQFNISGKPKIGLIKELNTQLFTNMMGKDVYSNYLSSIKLLSQDFDFVEISFKDIEYSLPAYYIITPSEISSNMARYDGIRFGGDEAKHNSIDEIYYSGRELFEDEVKRRIFIGNFSLSSGYADKYYENAVSIRNEIRNKLSDIFNSIDAIFLPTSPNVAFEIGSKTTNPVEMYMEDIFTVSANIAGIPAISIPSGFNEKHLPIGMQLFAKRKDDFKLLSFANRCEEIFNFNND